MPEHKPLPPNPDESRVEPAVTSIEDLSDMFTNMILKDEDHGRRHSIEGLAYASLQAKVKESIVNNKPLLEKLVTTLKDAPPRSPMTYGLLSIFVNLTKYLPTLSDEEKKMSQLKAYANAAGKLPGPDPLNEDERVDKRCKLVFDAGIVPVLSTQCKHGSPASLSLIISVIHALSVTKTIRGQLAQQGAVKLLLVAWTMLPETEVVPRRWAGQALSRILISTNPALVFGGNRTNPASAAIRPLVSIIPPDPAAETRDLLPTFEGLMALTNLASMEDEEIRRSIITTAWTHIEEQLLSTNHLVSKAAVELICNLVQSPEAISLYAEETLHARDRLHILLALADAEDDATRSAAGGALATLTEFEPVVRGILARDRGLRVLLAMCVDDDEGIRHRGVFCMLNVVSAEGETGLNARQRTKDENGIETLKECLKKSRRPEVLEMTVKVLKALLEEDK